MTDDPEKLLRRLVDHHRRGERITEEEHNDARLWVMSLLLDNLIATQNNTKLIKSSSLDAETIAELKSLMKALDAYVLVGRGLKHFFLTVAAIVGAILLIKTAAGDWIKETIGR